jgi:hypothetical protein
VRTHIRRYQERHNRPLAGMLTGAGLRYPVQVLLTPEEYAALERLRAPRRLSRAGYLRLLLAAIAQATEGG